MIGNRGSQKKDAITVLNQMVKFITKILIPDSDDDLSCP